MPDTPNNKKSEPLARSLGKFFGHLARGFTADVGGKKTQELSRTVEEERSETSDGKSLTLRRTTIEEIEVSDGTRERE